MRTRTLLLLAVGTGLAILVAGVLQLLRVAGQDNSDETYSIGEAVEVGDLTIVVESFDERRAQAAVDVELGGVDDEDGAVEFRLVIPGESLVASGASPDACTATTEQPRRCVLLFDLGDAPGGSRILLYRRGDEVARWELADTSRS